VLWTVCIFLTAGNSFSQTAFVRGTVKGTDGKALDRVNIAIREKPTVLVYSAEDGSYTIEIESGKIQTLVYFDISHNPQTYTVIAVDGQLIQHSVQLVFKNDLKSVDVIDFRKRGEEIVVLDSKILKHLPTVGQNVEDIIKTQMGVSSNNELSSGYSVRGRYHHENLVYVNDIEVYRPFLVRSGQQE